MPETVKITDNFGRLCVHFEDNHIEEGIHAFIEGEEQTIKGWLSPFPGVPIGDGNPMFERFTIMHTTEEGT